MKFVLILIATFFNQFTGFGQSPFNYGQNKQVYFISAEHRNTLGLNLIYTIDQQKDGEVGGMYENWDVTVISFDGNTISDDWAPISKDSNYKFDFDELTDSLHFLNGTRYELSGNQLTAYGGGGYGSFDWKQVELSDDTVTIISTSCVGHCGGNANTSYSKNVGNKQGQLLYTVFYPKASDSMMIDSEGGMLTLADYEDFFTAIISEENFTDTLFYKYDERGLLLSESRQIEIDSISGVKELFTWQWGRFTPNKFHQCYVGKTKMENYIKNKLGFLPELVLIEIYDKGVFSFALNSTDKKYYQRSTIILER